MGSPKYNRTMHLPWSLGGTSDDKIAPSVDTLLNRLIVITEKIDGSNTSLEHDGCYARTHASVPTHASFDGLKVLHATVKYQIPEGLQLFGEWCYAKHSIGYDQLPGYFLLFNIRDNLEDRNNGDQMWFGWDDVEAWAQRIEVPTVPVLFKGTFTSENELKNLTKSLMLEPSCCGGEREGVVVRVASAFADEEFADCVMKCVRANHVQTTEHWKDQKITKNKLKI